MKKGKVHYSSNTQTWSNKNSIICPYNRTMLSAISHTRSTFPSATLMQYIIILYKYVYGILYILYPTQRRRNPRLVLYACSPPGSCVMRRHRRTGRVYRDDTHDLLFLLPVMSLPGSSVQESYSTRDSRKTERPVRMRHT